MAWSDIFPIFDDSHADNYIKGDPSDSLSDHFEIAGIFGQQPQQHVLSASLFWKNVNSNQPDILKPSREMLLDPDKFGITRRYHPWLHYVKPILQSRKAVEIFGSQFDLDFKVRVYLASDLEFLIEDLLEASVEVHLMKSPSVAFCPGGLWRFLAFDDASDGVTSIIDADMLFGPSLHIEACRRMIDNDLGAWRYFNGFENKTDDGLYYRPMWGFGSGIDRGRHDRNWGHLLKTFARASIEGGFEPVANHPTYGRQPIVTSAWPNYGFDEWWMQSVLYPRACRSGLLTYTSHAFASWSFAADVEYTTWANPKSTLIIVPPIEYKFLNSPTKSCSNKEKTRPEIASPSTRSVPPVESFRSIAFLMLVRDQLPHEEIWKEYFEGHELAELFIHPQTPIASSLTLPKLREIDDLQPTAWGTASLVDAMLKLLDTALAETDASHFMFVSESCLPIRPLKELIQCLKLDPRSWIGAETFDEIAAKDWDKTKRIQGVQGLDQADILFHSQWVLLNRNHALMLSDHCDSGKYADTFAPDEFAFGSTLKQVVPDFMDGIVRNEITYADWTAKGPHPKAFTHVSPEEAVKIRTSGKFFARKFSPDSNIGTYRFHLS